MPLWDWDGRVQAPVTAAVQATEEAIINAIVGAETMTGANGHKVYALPHDQLQQTLKKYNWLVEK